MQLALQLAGMAGGGGRNGASEEGPLATVQVGEESTARPWDPILPHLPTRREWGLCRGYPRGAMPLPCSCPGKIKETQEMGFKEPKMSTSLGSHESHRHRGSHVLQSHPVQRKHLT